MSTPEATLQRLIVIFGTSDKELSAGLKGVDQKVGSLTSRMAKMGQTLRKALIVPMLAVGALALKGAADLEKGMSRIRVQTGATGEALAALGRDYRAVLRTVPQGAEEVGDALGYLQTRTGLTGEALQRLTKTELDLARITRTDVASLLNYTTRMFGDWSIATDDQTGSLDYLFKVSQKTGTSVDRLAMMVVQYGGPMRQLGFDFETATALLGKFEAEGVNTELVLGSLRISLGKMAREGVRDPAKALQTLIERIKNAGTAGEANALALEWFGARAGADMAAAIREGRFDLDALIKALAESKETIAGAAEEATTLGERFGTLRNKVVLTLEPLGRLALEKLENQVIPALERGAEWVAEFIRKWDLLPDVEKKIVTWSVGTAAALILISSWITKIIAGLKLLYALSPVVLGGIAGYYLGTWLRETKFGKWVEENVWGPGWEREVKKNQEYWDAYFAEHPEQLDLMGPAGLDLNWKPPVEEPWTPPFPGALPPKDYSGSTYGPPAPQKVHVSGSIDVLGISNENELIAVTQIIAEELARDALRYAPGVSGRRELP